MKQAIFVLMFLAFVVFMAVSNRSALAQSRSHYDIAYTNHENFARSEADALVSPRKI